MKRATLIPALAGAALAVAGHTAASAETAPAVEAAPPEPLTARTDYHETWGGQFVAKVYTEALGRLPTSEEWRAGVARVTGRSCTRGNLGRFAAEIFASPNYAGLRYSPRAKALTLGRALLNRDPDLARVARWSVALRTRSAGEMAARLARTRAFAALVPRICAAAPYGWDGTSRSPLAWRPTGNFAGGRAIALQRRLDRAGARGGGTVYLDPDAVVTVEAGESIYVPPRVTLATWGVGSRRRYAEMARIVRIEAPDPAHPGLAQLVRIGPRATLRHVWVDGNRPRFARFAEAMNIRVLGSGGRILECRSSDPVGSAGLQLFDGVVRAIAADNLVTAYATSHYRTSRGAERWTDGINVAARRAQVYSNEVVDATDLGIVVFADIRGWRAQLSQVFHNTIVNAGNSAFGALGFEPRAGTGATVPFSAAGEAAAIRDNTLWTSPTAHVHMGLVLGSRAWWGERGNVGRGATAERNRTPEGLELRAGYGIAVDGMDEARVEGNELAVALGPWVRAGCGFVPALVAARPLHTTCADGRARGAIFDAVAGAADDPY